MKVLVTGKDGFIGASLVSSLAGFELTPIGRSDLDLCDRSQVNRFFEQKTFDIVIHTAASGGKRDILDGPDVFQNNLLMFYNLLHNKHKFKKLIQLGSGAEFDRFSGRNIDSHSQINLSFPVDAYGMSKNIISRICDTEKNCYIFYIYNVFGQGETPTRMITNNITRYVNNEDIIINKNKIMDFFSIEDFVKLCKLYITNENLPKSVQCCYFNKTTLLDVASIINNLDSHKVNIKLLNSEMDFSYYGSSSTIDSLPITLTGLEQGIQNMYYNTLSRCGRIIKKNLSQI